MLINEATVPARQREQSKMGLASSFNTLSLETMQQKDKRRERSKKIQMPHFWFAANRRNTQLVHQGAEDKSVPIRAHKGW